MSAIQISPIVRKLASNSRQTRDETLNVLRSYITTRQFLTQSQQQFYQLWKGLYYAMWFSDRPRPQQRLAQQLADLHLLYANSEHQAEADRAFICFALAFWKIICLQWHSIDHHRLDKFLLLIRRVLHSQIQFLHVRNWDADLVECYLTRVLCSLPLSGQSQVSPGIPLHIVDIFIDEWDRLMHGTDSSVTGQVTPAAPFVKPLTRFLDVFRNLQTNSKVSKILRNRIREDLFSDPRLRTWRVLSSEDIPTEKTQKDCWHGF